MKNVFTSELMTPKNAFYGNFVESPGLSAKNQKFSQHDETKSIENFGLINKKLIN
jgi:hypothetical protein